MLSDGFGFLFAYLLLYGILGVVFVYVALLALSFCINILLALLDGLCWFILLFEKKPQQSQS